MDEELIRFACGKMHIPIYDHRKKVDAETFKGTHVYLNDGEFVLWTKIGNSWDVKPFSLDSWELLGMGWNAAISNGLRPSIGVDWVSFISDEIASSAFVDIDKETGYALAFWKAYKEYEEAVKVEESVNTKAKKGKG